jgi:transcriptional regulator with XRE-family HTH domain
VYASPVARPRKNPQIGERIRTARAEKGWKQKHLAAAVSVEPITVSRWERGATTPDLQVLGLVAEATGRPLAYFVGDGSPAATASLDDAAARIEAAAVKVADATERIAIVASELVEELRAARAGS